MADSGLSFDCTQNYAATDAVPIYHAILSGKPPVEITLAKATSDQQAQQWLLALHDAYKLALGRRSQALVQKMDIAAMVTFILPDKVG